MTALAFFVVGILGITARSSYMERKGSMAMPHLLDGGGGGVAAEIVQTTLEFLLVTRAEEYRRSGT